jgi:hypothetical protein
MFGYVLCRDKACLVSVMSIKLKARARGLRRAVGMNLGFKLTE